MKRLLILATAFAMPACASSPPQTALAVAPSQEKLSDRDIIDAFSGQDIKLNHAELQGIRDNVLQAVEQGEQHGAGNSKVDFAAVEVASDLGLDTSPGSTNVAHVRAAIQSLLRRTAEWASYYDETINLWNQPDFLTLVGEKGFSPVKISWEDIGRYENSVWGDRISDVGIWVRRAEDDPGSAALALSVRRDNNFRDKVLVVPADRIKVHVADHGRITERTLPERLHDLGLTSRTKDRNVIVSNQFAIVPVPARTMRGTWAPGHPPRAAFTFSIFPYGSTNMVITDVIEGSHEAVVGPGGHQLLFANADGARAPFTASRAADRPDLLALEKELKSKGMDVDVQRYYLIQIPLRRDAGVTPANMGNPPMSRGPIYPEESYAGGYSDDSDSEPLMQLSKATESAPASSAPPSPAPAAAKSQGLAKVAIGTGEKEGKYSSGSGWQGKRAEEPVRVTVVYFVTPVGKVTREDMNRFADAFTEWDSQALWGGSFVTKESW
jgi:hypothetical protein